jgi:AraC-like DNA-binding protein
MIGALLWYGGKRYLRRQARRNDAHLKREVAMARLNGLAEEDDDDKNFLREMMRNIEENIDRSDYDVEQMARKMNVSKSTLHRRVKALCGLTPFELIRSIKMKKATEMLMTGHRSISEIAYSLGFNNPKYFTKCFKDEYNETPTHYQQKHSEGV